MIDLSTVRLILWDFDDTLCFHSDHTSSDEPDIDYIVGMLQHDDAVFEDGEPNMLIKQFMHQCAEQGIRQGLISCCCDAGYVSMIAKHDWVLKNYEIDLENYCVASQRVKIDMLRALCEANDFAYDEVLFVDDMVSTSLGVVADIGIQAATPVEVINYVLRDSK